MTVNEVYAMNIQPSQVVARLGCSLDDVDVIDEERRVFLDWLNVREMYPDQVMAWNEYDFVNWVDRTLHQIDESEDINEESIEDTWFRMWTPYV